MDSLWTPYGVPMEYLWTTYGTTPSPHARRTPTAGCRQAAGAGAGRRGSRELADFGLWTLAMWVASTEGAKFWQHVLTELKNRGVRDIFIGCVDGLKGFPEAMEVVFPMTQVQLCLVHMVRHSLSYVGWKERKAVANDLKPIYRAATEAEAEQALRVFEQKWDRKYPMIGKSWRR